MMYHPVRPSSPEEKRVLREVARKRLRDDGWRRKAIAPEQTNITFVCPNCEQVLKIPIMDLQGGMVITCIKCDEEIVETRPTGDGEQ